MQFVPFKSQINGSKDVFYVSLTLYLFLTYTHIHIHTYTHTHIAGSHSIALLTVLEKIDG
jgi:hypothetical protein